MKLFLVSLTFGMFSIPLTSASAQPASTTLEALRDRQRVLLVFSNGDNALAEAQLSVAAEHAAEFRDRDLVLTGIAGSNPAVPTAMLSAEDDRAARKRFHVQQGRFTVILIGKDEGEKLRSERPIPWQTLQQTIDSMPMRKDEMRLP